MQLCRFTAQPRNVRDSVAKLVAGHSCLAAAIDGPLARGFEEIGRYRTAERMLTRAFRTTIGKPGQSNSPNGILLNRVANQAALALGQLGPVEIEGFVRRPVVVGVLDGTVRTDGRPVGEDGTALPGQA